MARREELRQTSGGEEGSGSENWTTEVLFCYLLFLAALGLHCCARAFSSCDQRAPHCSGFSCCGRMDYRVYRLQSLWPTGLVAPRHVESSRTRDQTHVPSVGWQILNHWITREVPCFSFEQYSVCYIPWTSLKWYKFKLKTKGKRILVECLKWKNLKVDIEISEIIRSSCRQLSHL